MFPFTMSKKKKPEEDILRSSIETSKIDNAILAAAQNDSDWGGTVGNSGGGGCGGVVSKSNKSIGVSLPSVLRSQKPMATPGRCVYAAVGRQKPMKSSAVTMCEAYSEDIPVIAVELGRKMLGRKALPGWDDINCEGWRAIKLSVHDMGGATGYIVVFGGDFSAKRAQAIVERFALMLGPLLDGQLMDGDAPTIDKASVQAADEARQCSPQAALEMHKTMEPVLMRELQHANGKEKIVEVENQISEVRNIMEKNVELILDRQEQLESLEAKSTELEKGAKQFRKGTRKLRRWHLMNQVKFGVAVGTVISLAVAVPIVLLVAV